MTASFPASIRPFSARADLVDVVIANDVNSLQEEVASIEKTIGTAGSSNKPLASTYSGSFALTTTWTTISDRLANIEAGLVNGTGSSSIYATKASPTFTGTATIPSLILTNALLVSYGGTGLTGTTKGGLLVGTGSSAFTNLTVGTDGYLLTADSAQASGVKWAAAPVSLPSQTGNNGKWLTTDGSSASWATITLFPSQTGNAGKYLTTDGSNPSWASFTAASTSVAGIVQLTDSTSSTSTTTAATPNSVKAAYDLAANASNGQLNGFLLAGMGM